MFDSPEFPKSLGEDVFEAWLEKGRESPITYEYMLIVWDGTIDSYQPLYAEDREDVKEKNPGFYGESPTHTATIAIYDLFSESKLGFEPFRK